MLAARLQAIEIFREDEWFFTQALRISDCPSQSTLRQRIDLIGEAANNIIKEACAEMIRKKAPAVSPIKTSAGDFIPLDMDVSPFDNSKTQKEGVSRTYKGCDGYAPMLGYLGQKVTLSMLSFEKVASIARTIPLHSLNKHWIMAEITQEPLLIRLDSGNDSQDNFMATKNGGESIF